jgi:hypothetical protein
MSNNARSVVIPFELKLPHWWSGMRILICNIKTAVQTLSQEAVKSPCKTEFPSQEGLPSGGAPARGYPASW